MSLSSLKKAALSAKPQEEETKAPVKSGLSGLGGLSKKTTNKISEDDVNEKSSSTALKSGGAKSGGMGFLKKGKEAKEALAQAEQQQALNKEKQGKMFVYRMSEGEERRITFLDGDLDDDGILDITMYHEHNLKIGGNYDQYVCTAEVDTSQPCPLCAAGEKRYLVGLMTIIDHTPYVIKNGAKAGQKVENQRKLFKCKQGTIKVLTKIASKKGGLTGWTYDVTRSGGDKSPSVGDVFMFDEQWDSREAFAAKHNMKLEEVQPAVYDQEIIYKTPEELIELGVGKSFTGVGTKKNGSVDTGSLKGQL